MRSFDLRIAIKSIRKLDMSFGWGNITNRAVHLGGILKIPLQHQVCKNSCQTVQTIQHDLCGETSSQILGVQKKQQPTSDGKSARLGRQRPNKKMQYSGCGCFKFQYCKRCAELRHQTGCSHKLCDSKRRLASIALEFVTICGLQQYFNRCLSQQKPEGCCTKSGSSVAQAAQRKIRRAPVVGLGSVEGKMWPGASFPRYAQESPSLHGSSRFLVSNRFKIMSSFDNPNSESPHPNLPLLANRTTLS